MSEKSRPSRRSDYPRFVDVPTRWNDNDSYGHINNVVYYALFDTAINQHLIECGVLDIATSSTIGLVLETKCHYFSSISFPDLVALGLKVVHLGNSSVRYEIGIFLSGAEQASAVGSFVHVYVNRASNRPVPIPSAVRTVLETLVVR